MDVAGATRVQFNQSNHTQGAWLEWNKDNASGRTYLLNHSGGFPGGFIFGEVDNGNTITERMRIDNNGNLGVGTTAPSQKLDVAGSISATNSISVDAAQTNGGSVLNNSLKFGGILSGEGIGSKRTAAGNQFGMDFYTNNINRMVISNAGNVGIGEVAPHAPLQFATSNQKRKIVLFETANNDNQFYGFGVNGGELRYQTGVVSDDHVFYAGASSTTSNELMRIKGNGQVGIGIAPILGYRLTIAGYGLASGGNWDASDARYKKNVEPINSALESILKLRGVTYNFKTDEFPQWNFDVTKQIGVIAQEVEKVLPELVKTDDKGYKAVSYEKFTPVLIEAVKEQQKQIEAKDAKIEAQQKQIDVLSAQMKEVQTALTQCCSNYTPSSSKSATGVSAEGTDKASIEQNAPNPFSEETTIRYYLPSNSTAMLKVMSLDGKEMFSTPVTKSGYSEVIISGSSMAAGTYTYTLIVNGKAVESKLMVLTK